LLCAASSSPAKTSRQYERRHATGRQFKKSMD